MLNFVYLRSSRLHFLLDSCIVHKGEKFEHALACCMHLEGFQVVLVSSSDSSRFFPGGTGLTDKVHRSNQCECQVLDDLVHRSDRCG
jgi:hypothetical protein